jgi:histone acetyltransferase 1
MVGCTNLPAHLYSALFEHMLSRDEVAELTVEDPAEAFEDLRDRNDLRFLVKEGVPDDANFLTGVGIESRGERAAWEAALRKKYKIAQVSCTTWAAVLS